MIDASEMARVYSKTIGVDYDRVKPSRWTKSVECQNYVNALINAGLISASNQVIRTSLSGNKGKRGGGHTWMNRRLAIRYAQWLDPMFAIWVDSKIDELINDQIAFLDNSINQLQTENTNLKAQLTAQQPAMNYYNRVLSQNNGYTTREICAQLGLRISNKKLIQMLVDGGYMYRDKSGKPYLKDPWSKQGFQTTIYEPCSDGIVRPFLKWTEVGKQFILERALDWKLI